MSALVGVEVGVMGPAQDAALDAQIVSKIVWGRFSRSIWAVHVRRSVPSMEYLTPAGVHSMSYWWKSVSALAPRLTIWGSCVGLTDVVQLAAGVPTNTCALSCEVVAESPRCSMSISFQLQFGNGV